MLSPFGNHDDSSEFLRRLSQADIQKYDMKFQSMGFLSSMFRAKTEGRNSPH